MKLLENQKFDEFFSDFNFKKGKVVISQISEMLTKIVEKINPNLKILFLRRRSHIYNRNNCPNSIKSL